jgi:hypothetical protein
MVSRMKNKTLVISAVVFVTAFYWIPKIIHEIRLNW